MTKLGRLLEPFEEDQIEWRIGHSGQKDGKPWAMVLAYVTSRAVMERLDEVFGPLGWKTEFRFVEGQNLKPGVICRLSVWDGAQWVTKEDGSDQSDTEAFKGGISASLKRAAVQFGIGRYLYSLEGQFAVIVERGTKGAIYCKPKDGQPFFWVPPKLPAWALPSKKPPPVVYDETRDLLMLTLNARTTEGWTGAALGTYLKHAYGVDKFQLLNKEQQQATIKTIRELNLNVAMSRILQAKAVEQRSPHD